ncbi:hypothetical protein F3Y22_tig00110377pilonHSYRG00213 [Hibiscus syriacus]|uniref:RRM domain-containing protein n=1 Tax=Hibiscus syriacus TaxID=106335 RepID=A0A6A3AVD5_HIBSY|nr:hypothetical protein F3Y22_tig00110377pilonHSYRG00213 [Hibiscus syriacus]
MERKEGETTTLFAQNIPPIYHWRGLRQLFGRHGDVVSSFIVRKYDRVGKRFGFVSFSNKNDADRAALRLNGLWILRYRLTVKEARYRDKSQSRKLYTPSDSKVVSSAKQEKNSISRASMEEQTMRSSKIVQGEVDENVENSWSYLKEVFLDVQPWTESYRPSQRVTWIKLCGVPLHCWNHVTFKRIAEQWGEFLAMGENALKEMYCDEVTILITTDRKEFIDDVLDLEVDRDLFKVRILEQIIGSSVSMVQKRDKKRDSCLSGEDVGEKNIGEEAIMGLRTNDDGSGNVQKRSNDEVKNVEGVEVTAEKYLNDQRRVNVEEEDNYRDLSIWDGTSDTRVVEDIMYTNLQARWQRQKREVKKTLQIGRALGIEFEGPKEILVWEIVAAEESEGVSQSQSIAF